MEQNVADLLTDAFSDVEIDFEHLNFDYDYAEQSLLTDKAPESEKRDNTQEPTGARRPNLLQSSEKNHNMHKNSTGKETYAQDTGSETDEELSHPEDIKMSDRKKCAYDSCDIWQAEEDETRNWTERLFPVEGAQTGVDHSNAGGTERCGNIQNEESEDGVPFLQLCNPQSVDDTCSYSDSNSGSEDAEATRQQHLSVDREAMNEQGAQTEGWDLREFSEEDHACVGEDFAEYPTELTDDDDDDDVEGDDEEEDDDYEDERRVKSVAKAHLSRIGADNTQEGKYVEEEEEEDEDEDEDDVEEEEEDKQQQQQQEQTQEEEEDLVVEVIDDILEHRPMHAKPKTTSQTLSGDDSGPQDEDESESPSMQQHRHNNKLSQIQEVFTDEDTTAQQGRVEKEIIAQGIAEEERHGEGQNVVKLGAGVAELPSDSENDFLMYSHHVDPWGGWREDLNRYMFNTELNLDVNISELDVQDPDFNIPNIRDCGAVAREDESRLLGRIDTITPERAWPSETLWDEVSQQHCQPLRNPSGTSRQEFVVVEDVTSGHDFLFETSLDQDSHVTDGSLGGCLLDEDTAQEGMEDNTSDTFGEEERSWDQERERIEAFNRFYNYSESSTEGIEERTHKVHFCLEPQIVEVLDSESEYSDTEADEDSEEYSDTENIHDESDTEEPQENVFPCHDREEPSENEFPPQNQEEPSENEFPPQDHEEPSENVFPPQDQDQEEQTENAQDQDLKFEEVQPIYDNPTTDQLMKKVTTDQPMEKQLTDQPVEEEDVTLQTLDKQKIVTPSPTTSKRQKSLRILKSTLKMCAIIGTGLVTFWWATDHLDWTMW
ncbi:probable serine/threonine-protein kinase kinX isoform X2 [Sardina pilchardus]|uniref:probable serine/threonine-protein kinase kinX isoform X2 n=1 Tax=Sardina pilchardus TaxID=27697 RepID=UPI002E15B644